MPAEIGQPAPHFELRNQEKELVSLDALKGNKSLVVFIPFPFTGICDAEACMLRDSLGDYGDLDANVVVITTHAVPSNKQWADAYDIDYPVLSDYWPHGATAQAYGTFNEALGVAMRSTYVLDADGIVRDIIATDALGVQREHDLYAEALGKI